MFGQDIFPFKGVIACSIRLLNYYVSYITEANSPYVRRAPVAPSLATRAVNRTVVHSYPSLANILSNI